MTVKGLAMKDQVTTFCITALSLVVLSGCTAVLPTAPMTLTENPMSNSSISVDALLAKARGESARGESALGSGNTGASVQSLTLHFNRNSTLLSDEHRQQLNTFANLFQSRNLSVDCAPSDSQNRLEATSVAINRCRQVGEFLTRRTHRSHATIQPDLTANQVVISRLD